MVDISKPKMVAPQSTIPPYTQKMTDPHSKLMPIRRANECPNSPKNTATPTANGRAAGGDSIQIKPDTVEFPFSKPILVRKNRF